MVSSQSLLHISQQGSPTIIMWQYVYKFCVNLTSMWSKYASCPCWTENPLGFSSFMGIQASSHSVIRRKGAGHTPEHGQFLVTLPFPHRFF